MKIIKLNLNEVGLFGIILLLVVGLSFFAPGFTSINNAVSILRDAASIGIAAWGMTLIIIAGEIDVSVGPMVAFVSTVLAFMLKAHLPMPLALALSVLLGGLLGALAGVLRAWFEVPSFIATLGLWSALRGLGLYMTDALPISYGSSSFMDSLADEIGVVPTAAVVMFVLFALFCFIANKTTFGRNVFAIGGNINAAKLCGINVKAAQVKLFVIGGMLAAVTGILLTARLGTGNAGAAQGLEFDVIAAVVVGGTALAGGKGSMLGTLQGVLVITLIGNGLVLLGIDPFLQYVVRGVIIVLAVLINIMAQKKK
ncbi:ABC transporter permease [Paraburkholderia caffeinilytica]|uniref:ABC transporter permease n=1 Tax=Paraburkholderia caffeinilytica TaxID=1761016 RepID=UPI0038B82C2D